MKLTKKDLKNSYSYIVRGGYCEFYNILRNAHKIGYGCGVYGWNWDAFEIETENGRCVCVCTGYRDMTGKRIAGLSEFEEHAKKIDEMPSNYSDRKSAQKKLLNEFAGYVIKHYND